MDVKRAKIILGEAISRPATVLTTCFAIMATLLLGAAPVAAQGGPSGPFRDGPYWALGAQHLDYRITGNTLRGDGQIGTNAAQESANLSATTNRLEISFGHEKRLGDGLYGAVELGLTFPGADHFETFITNSGTYTGQVGATIRYEQGPRLNLRAIYGRVAGAIMFYSSVGIVVLDETQTRTQYIGNGDVNAPQTSPSFNERSSRLRQGVSLGLGLRRAVSADWSVLAEIQTVRFGRDTFRFEDARGGVVPTGGYLSSQGRLAQSRLREDSIRIGLVRKF